MLRHVFVVADLGTQNIFCQQARQPVSGRVLPERSVQLDPQLRAVRRPRARAGEALVVNQLGTVNHTAKPFPTVAHVGGHHDPAIGGFKSFIRSRVRRGASNADRQHAIAQVAGDGR